MSGVFCSSCGKENSPDAYYCEFCGTALNKNIQSQNNNFSSGSTPNMNSGSFYQGVQNQNVSYGSGQNFNSNPNMNYNSNPNPNPNPNVNFGHNMNYNPGPSVNPNMNYNPNNPFGNINTTPQEKNPTIWIVLNIVFSIISLLFVPILFGGLAIFFGFMVKKEKPSLGNILIGTAIGALVLGILFGILVNA